MRLRISIRGFVRPSVRPWVRPSRVIFLWRILEGNTLKTLNLTFNQSDNQPIWHSTHLTFKQSDIQTIWHSNNLTFNQSDIKSFDIQSIWYSINLMFNQSDIQPIYIIVSYLKRQMSQVQRQPSSWGVSLSLRTTRRVPRPPTTLQTLASFSSSVRQFFSSASFLSSISFNLFCLTLLFC